MKSAKHENTGNNFVKNILTSKLTKALQFDMRCEAICRDFDCECEFLQGTYNVKVPHSIWHFRSKTRYAICQCNEYNLDLLMLN